MLWMAVQVASVPGHCLPFTFYAQILGNKRLADNICYACYSTNTIVSGRDVLGRGVLVEIKLFTDDSLLYRRIQDNADCHQLQEILDKLQEWEHKWQMGFNADKCEVIRITNKKRPLCSDYSIHNQQLTIMTETKYLGVTISSDLSWSRHADIVTKKANSTMDFLKRNIRSAPQAAKELGKRHSSDQ